MFIRALIFALGLLLGLSTNLNAGTRDPDTPDAKYLEFGQKFPSVLRLRAITDTVDPKTGEKQPTLQNGSAVVIKPNWALTAAHVVVDAAAHELINDEGEIYPLTFVIVPKEFKPERMGYYDVALCYSPKDFNLDFYTPLHEGPENLDDPITIAGYGLHGTFHTGYQFDDGKKRAGHNKIEGLERGILICKPTPGKTRMPLEYMISPGDSGGGMFIGNKLAGINSFLMASDQKPNGTYGDESAFTRVSLYADWVKSQIEKHELAFAGRGTTGAELDFDISSTGIKIVAVDLHLP
jgi:hypothetical protein